MQNFFTFSPTNISAALILFNLIFSFCAAFFIAWVYRKTHSGLSYSFSFFTTLVLVAPIVTVVIMVVQNNIYGALGLLGAFALIRFRTIVKETRDISFLFFSLVEGVAVGSGHYSMVLISTIFIAAIAFLMHKFKFGSSASNRCILMITSTSQLNPELAKETAKNFGVLINILSSKKIDEEYEYTYSLDGKNSETIQQYLTELNNRMPIKSYDLISGKDAVEY